METKIIETVGNIQLIRESNGGNMYFKINNLDLGFDKITYDSYFDSLNTTLLMALPQDEFLKVKRLWNKYHSLIYKISMYETHGFDVNLGQEMFYDILNKGKFMLFPNELEDIEFFVKHGYEKLAPPQPQKPRSKARSCKYTGYIYLAFDENNECTKIGYSNNPEYREKTLQSEKPFITIIATVEGNNKDETRLHQKYKDKRIRGEWFWLTDVEIKEILEFYQNRKISKSPDFEKIVNSLKRENY